MEDKIPVINLSGQCLSWYYFAREFYFLIKHVFALKQIQLLKVFNYLN